MTVGSCHLHGCTNITTRGPYCFAHRSLLARLRSRLGYSWRRLRRSLKTRQPSTRSARGASILQTPDRIAPAIASPQVSGGRLPRPDERESQEAGSTPGKKPAAPVSQQPKGDIAPVGSQIFVSRAPTSGTPGSKGVDGNWRAVVRASAGEAHPSREVRSEPSPTAGAVQGAPPTDKTAGNQRGRRFEDAVGAALEALRSLCPELVEVRRQPLVKLLNGVELRPDFELIYTQSPHRNVRLIECQSRAKSDHSLAQKIQRMKVLSPHNRFIVVYEDADYLSVPVRNDLDSDGIVHYSFKEFVPYLVLLGRSLRLTAPLAKANATGRLQEFLQSEPDVLAAFRPHGLRGVSFPSKVEHKDEGMLSSTPPSWKP
jgi:hypothetical protein